MMARLNLLFAEETRQIEAGAGEKVTLVHGQGLADAPPAGHYLFNSPAVIDDGRAQTGATQAYRNVGIVESDFLNIFGQLEERIRAGATALVRILPYLRSESFFSPRAEVSLTDDAALRGRKLCAEKASAFIDRRLGIEGMAPTRYYPDIFLIQPKRTA